ncbi:MAG: EamA family transporter [Patescibacteria group bacterium]
MWFAYSIGAAVFRAVKDAGYKLLLENSGSLEAVFCFWIFTLAVLVPSACVRIAYLKSHGRAIVGDQRRALQGLLGAGLLDIFAYWSFMEALKRGDLSIALPLRNLVPLFGLFVGMKMLKERLGPTVVIGTLFVVGGVLIMHVQAANSDAAWGIFAAMTNPASLLAMGSAFLFAWSAMCNRVAVAPEYGKMDVIVFTASLITLSTIGYGVLVILIGNPGEVALMIRENYGALGVIGVLGAIGSLLTALAFSSGEMTKVVPALRMQIPIGIIIGGLFLHEKEFATRFAGGILLTVGVVLIAIASALRKGKSR